MAVTVAELLERNKTSAANHTPIPTIDELQASGSLPKTIIITCCDPRCIPENFFDIKTGEVIVHRNAGGNIRHALRDIVLLDYIVGGLDEIAIIHHSGCGATHITEEGALAHLKGRLDEKYWDEAEKLVPFGVWKDVAQSVRNDVAWLRANPLVRKELTQAIKALVFDIKTGKVERISEE